MNGIRIDGIPLKLQVPAALSGDRGICELELNPRF
jgi:hypothetical protein